MQIKIICPEFPQAVRPGRFAFVNLDKSQGFTLSKHKGASMKPSKKKPAIKSKATKTKKQLPVKNNETKVTQEKSDILGEYDFSENVLNNFSDYEPKYLSEIFELFSVFEDEFKPITIWAESEPIEIDLLQIPFFYVFLSANIDRIGQERIIDDGCYEIEDVNESSTKNTIYFFSGYQGDSKREKYFINAAKDDYKRAISRYARFDYRFNKMMESFGIETNLKEI